MVWTTVIILIVYVSAYNIYIHFDKKKKDKKHKEYIKHDKRYEKPFEDDGSYAD